MDLNIQNILNLYIEKLQITFSAQNDQERKIAEDQLLNFSLNDPQFLQHMLTIARSKNYSNPQRASSCTYISAYLKKNYKKNSQDEQNMVQDSIFLYNCLADDQLENSYKSIFQEAFEYILNFDTKNNIKTQLITTLYEQLNSIQNLSQLQHLFRILQILLKSFKTYQTFIDKLFPVCVIQGEFVMQQLNSNIQTEEQYVYLLETLILWSQQINKMIEILCKKIPNTNEKKQCIYQQFQNQNLCSMITKLLNFNFYQSDQQIKMCYFSTSGNKVLDDLNNRLKKVTIKWYNKLINFQYDQRNKFDCTQSALYNTMPVDPMLNSIINLFSNMNYEQIQSNQPTQQLLTQIFIFLSEIFQDKNIKVQFKPNIIVFNVIYLVFALTNKDRLQSKKNAQDFLNSFYELFKQKPSLVTCRWAASKMLLALCKNYEGFTSFLIDSSINILLSPQDNNSAFFQQIQDPSLYVDDCLQIITICHSVIRERDDLILKINESLKIIEKNIIESKEYIIKSRLCVLYYYLHQDLLKTNLEYKPLIKFLISSFDNYKIKDGKILAIASIQTLKDIYEDVNSKKIISKAGIIKQFSKLIKHFKTCKIVFFYECMQNIISQFREELKNNQQVLKDCLNMLLGRILSEVSKFEENQSKTSIFVHQSLNLIKSILNEELVLDSNIPEIQLLFQPIFQLLQNPDKIEFEDDILYLINLIFRKQKSINDNYVPIFLKVLEKQKYLDQQLYQTINSYIFYGKLILQNDFSIVCQLIDISFKCINYEDPDRQYDVYRANGANLLHNVIENLSGVFTTEIWTAIIHQVIQKLKTVILSEYLRIRLMGVILMTFIVNLQLNQNILFNMNENIFYLDLLLKIDQSKMQNYDKKILVIGLSHVIQNADINDQLYSIVTFLITILGCKEIKDQPVITNQDKVDEEEEDEEEQEVDQYKLSLEDQDKQNLSQMLSLIIQNDEYQIFQNMITNLKNRNQQVFEQFFINLAPQNQQILKDLFAIKLINVNEQQQARKIVKVRRNQ